jgi:hypothetical protein
MKIKKDLFKNNFSKEFLMWLLITKYIFFLICCSVPDTLLIFRLVEFVALLLIDYTIRFLAEGFDKSFENEGILVKLFFTPCIALQFHYYFCFIFWFIFGVLTVTPVFIKTHRSLQNNFSSKRFEFKRDGTLTSDMKFISTWLFIGSIFHTVMINAYIEGFILNLLSTYGVMSTIFYVMIRKKSFGHSIRKRRQVLKA